MNDSQIAATLRERNPWWRDPASWKQADRNLQVVAKASIEYTPEPLTNLQDGALYTLLGPRRVGKSVELRRAIATVLDGGVDSRRVIYCSCDGFRPQDLRRMFVVGRKATDTVDAPRIWFVDEITAVRGWSAIVKDARSESEVGDEIVVLAGSSMSGFRDAVRDLAGRRGPALDSDRLLLPMSFRDFCLQRGTDIPQPEPLRVADLQSKAAAEVYDELSYWMEDLNGAWDSYLQVGGFPRAVADFVDSGKVSDEFVRDLWEVIKGDVLSGSSLTDTQILGLLDRLAERMTTPINVTDIARDLGVASHNTISDRITDLAINFQLWRCHRMEPKTGIPNLNAQNKVYFHDPLLARLAQLRDHRRTDPDASKLSEQQLGVLLSRALDREKPNEPSSFIESHQVMYQRTPTKKEIDFVGPRLPVPVEGKYVERGWKQESLTVENAYRCGILATLSAYDRTGDVWAVPASVLAWALG